MQNNCVISLFFHLIKIILSATASDTQNNCVALSLESIMKENILFIAIFKLLVVTLLFFI